jgi:hypothetical protein
VSVPARRRELDDGLERELVGRAELVREVLRVVAQARELGRVGVAFVEALEREEPRP